MSKRIEIQEEADATPAEVGDALPETEGQEESNDNQPTEEKEPAQDDLSAEITAARQEAQQHYDRLLRVSADFENYKKRSAREMQDLVKYANERLLKELLGVVDNLERAIASATQTYAADDPLLTGVHLTLGETLKILERHQVTPIQSIGEPFDPNFHQAMMQEAVEDQPPNTVVKELQKGYLIHERLLRPALVVVSKTGGAKPEAAESTES